MTGSDTSGPTPAPEPGAPPAEPVAAASCIGPVCLTCSDTAVPVTVVRLLGADLAEVRTEAGTREEVSVALVEAAVGDVVLVHAGEAIGRATPP
ncbi:HypC/HybG/HupF family hydrogenase formation chaperone [Pseudonocardia sp. RS010]|uniref:HypC/HybG/HupF family hydrogenase formation chaperone n=1 Tax=Pseudonocardia sp. RS010 TaxID=3385979 RepID=UPI0039A3C5D3